MAVTASIDQGASAEWIFRAVFSSQLDVSCRVAIVLLSVRLSVIECVLAKISFGEQVQTEQMQYRTVVFDVAVDKVKSRREI